METHWVHLIYVFLIQLDSKELSYIQEFGLVRASLYL